VRDRLARINRAAAARGDSLGAALKTITLDEFVSASPKTKMDELPVPELLRQAGSAGRV
jgi:hypothetical protein